MGSPVSSSLSSLTGRVRAARFPLAAPPWPASVPRPDPERRVGLEYDHEWSRRYPVRLARAMVLDNITRPAARLLAPPTIRGLEHLQHLDGPVIFAANHASHIDTPLLLTTLPVEFRHRTVVAAASDYFFDRTWKSVVWSFALAAIPIERSRVNRKSSDTAAELIDDGWSLVIFPEGGRSPDGWTQPFHAASAGYLGKRTGRPVVPVYLHGTRHVLAKTGEAGAIALGGSGTESRRGGRLRRSPIAVLFGAPMTPDEGENTRRFSDRIEASVATLAREVHSDWWRARRAVSAADPSPVRPPRIAAPKPRRGAAPGHSTSRRRGTGGGSGRTERQRSHTGRHRRSSRPETFCDLDRARCRALGRLKLCNMGVHRSWPNRARSVPGWALLSIAVFAGWGQGAAASAPGSATTGTHIGRVLKPSPVRTGQAYVPAGRSATKGPIGRNPSREGGVPLNILSGLAHDEPIYDGDFADPAALPAASTLYLYASSSQRSKYDAGANVPIIALSRGNGFAGRFLGDALPKAPAWTVPRYQWGPDVWARPNGTYVLYYSTPATVPLGCLGTPPAHGCVKTVNG